jgi:DHA2 family multidrug resistance protein
MVLMEINPPEKQGPAMAVWGMGVMVGPILGPSLGGWLTDSYDWRWVFFINIPVGAMATYGIWRYIRPVPAARRVQFDMFGFATLSIFVGALQLLLDRGEQNDWFASAETWSEAIVMTIALTYFIAHTATSRADKSFLDYRLLKNGNFVSGSLFIFIVGMVMFGSRALVPTMLENLLGYPVATTGLVIAPSGLGTMATMMIAGRIMGRVDLRIILFAGLALTVLPLWQMTRYSLDLSQSDIVWPNVLQGMGIGLVFVPLSAASFATLSPSMRAQATSIFALFRNIGSSIGISIVQTVLVRSEVASHAALTERVTSANPAWNNPAVASAFDTGRTAGAAALDAVITQQSAMIAYINDFRLMMYLTLAMIPLLFLIRAPRRGQSAPKNHAVID